jgi:trehalose utilization protein
VQITIWNEFRHEKQSEEIAAIYPDGIHGALASHLGRVDRAPELNVRTATLDEPEHGLTQGVIDDTDVLIWWGHQAHAEVSDKIVDRVQSAVLHGMGLIALHSSHYAKPVRRLLGTSCGLAWREDGKHERLWVVDPTHPIAAGIDRYFEIPQTEMYGEYFDVPTPDELVFISWFAGGEVMRSGMVWKRGRGKIFYFRPGHETYPIYHQPEVLRVIGNACRYVCKPETATVTGIGDAPHVTESPEDIRL